MTEGYTLLFKLVTFLSVSLLITATAIGTWLYPQLPRGQKWFYYYLVFFCFIELSSRVLVFFGLEILMLYPIYMVGELVLLSRMFVISLNLSKKWFLAALIFSLIIGAESYYLNYIGEHITSGIGKTCSHLVIISFSGAYLIKTLRDFNLDSDNHFLPVFSAIFFYYALALFFFLLLKQLPDISMQQASMIWSMNNVLSSFFYGTTIYTLLTLKRSK